MKAEPKSPFRSQEDYDEDKPDSQLHGCFHKMLVQSLQWSISFRIALLEAANHDLPKERGGQASALKGSAQTALCGPAFANIESLLVSVPPKDSVVPSGESPSGMTKMITEKGQSLS